jgi:hypothetical protein
MAASWIRKRRHRYSAHPSRRGSDQGELTLDPHPLASSVTAIIELDRGDFGVSFNIPMDGGGVVIGDRIQVFLEIEAVLNPPRPANP